MSVVFDKNGGEYPLFNMLSTGQSWQPCISPFYELTQWQENIFNTMIKTDKCISTELPGGKVNNFIYTEIYI